MASNDFLSNIKQKVRAVYNNFFYEGEEAPAPAPLQEEAPAPDEQPVMAAQNFQQPYPNVNYTAPQPGAYAMDAPNAYYQQPAAPQAYFAAPQVESQQRNRRMQQHRQPQQSNVVDFGAYQQQPVSAQPAPQPSAPAPQPSAPSAQASVQASTRIINTRGMADCRSAITLLREGDAVLIVLENITDPVEMRRLVDTLSGACYSLTATITKVSRYGVYLLAPQAFAVYTDQATNQMNGAQVRTRAYQPAAQRPNFTAAPAQSAYTAQPQSAYTAPAQSAYTAQPQAAYAAPQQYAREQGAFTQRGAAPEAAAASFYARPAPQSAPTPAFSARPAFNGFSPDEIDAANQ